MIWKRQHSELIRKSNVTIAVDGSREPWKIAPIAVRQIHGGKNRLNPMISYAQRLNNSKRQEAPMPSDSPLVKKILQVSAQVAAIEKKMATAKARNWPNRAKKYACELEKAQRGLARLRAKQN